MEMNSFSFRWKDLTGGRNPYNAADGSNSCYLFEATGDSEVDCDIPNNVADETDLGDNDDAESCSCDVSDYSCVTDIYGANQVDQGEEAQVDDNDDENEEGKEKEKEGINIDQGYYAKWEGGGLAAGDAKSCVSVDSINEPLNEAEKNRLFWEACLASS